MTATALLRDLEVCTRSALATAPTAGVRAGVDLVRVAEVADSIEAFGERYLTRVFTPGELADCGHGGGSAVSASRLAARFAAKEAATKVLAPRDAPGWWLEIETVRLPSGACELHLHRSAAARAAELQLGHWGVSLTHEGEYAAAVVVATPHAVQPLHVPQKAAK